MRARVCVQDDDTDYVMLLSNTETAVSADDSLVHQLNIEKRPSVGNSLLATSGVLQVRADVSENGVTEDVDSGKHAAAYCSEGWMAGWQVTAGAGVEEQAMPHVSQKYDESLEIDLNLNDSTLDDIVSNPMYDAAALLAVIDKAADEGELNAVAGLLEDDIDGLPPCSAVPYTPVPDILNYQMPEATFGLPCMTEYSVPHSTLTGAAARPVGATTGLKSLPGVCGSVQTELSAVQGAGRRKVHYSSLPATLSNSSSTQFSPAAMSKEVDVAQKSLPVVSQQKAGPVHLQVIHAVPPMKSPLPTSLVADARLMPSAAQLPYSIVNLCSPVGQITGTMGGLSIDNSNHHPLLRGMLTETRHQLAARDQRRNSTEQVLALLFAVVLLLLIQSVLDLI